jgi:TRAP-type C4-dicarboxylate transport system permease small subunit
MNAMTEGSALQVPRALSVWWRLDEGLASAALVLMTLIPLIEIGLRPLLGSGVANAPVLVQHLGLVLAMFGALAAERHGHLASLGGDLVSTHHPRLRAWAHAGGQIGRAHV